MCNKCRSSSSSSSSSSSCSEKCDPCKRPKCSSSSSSSDCCESSSSSSDLDFLAQCRNAKSDCSIGSSGNISSDSSCKKKSSSCKETSSSSSSCQPCKKKKKKKCSSSSSSSSSCSSSSSSSESCKKETSSSSSSCQPCKKKKEKKCGKCKKVKCCCPPKKEKKCVEKVKGRKFCVTVESKCGSPWECRNTGETVFAIDGVKQKVLHVTRGHSYFFTLNQDPWFDGQYAQHLYFTADILGGPCEGGCDAAKLPGSPDPFGCGTACLKIDDCYPDVFYYQSRDFQAAGGIILVHGKGGKKKEKNCGKCKKSKGKCSCASGQIKVKKTRRVVGEKVKKCQKCKKVVSECGCSAEKAKDSEKGCGAN